MRHPTLGLSTLVLVLAGVASLSFTACGGGGGGGGAGTVTGQTGITPGGPAGATGLRAGAAAVDITPTTGGPLGGFGQPPRRKFNAVTIPLTLLAFGGTCIDPDPSDAVALFEPAQGVHDPIMARALAIEKDGEKFALVKIDTVGVSPRMRSDLESSAAALGIPPQNLLFCATHNHSGPGAVSEQLLWQLIAMDCFHEPTYRAMLEGVERALQQAVQALRPAEIGIEVGTDARIGRNRRGRPGVVDHELALIKVVEPSGAPIAAVMNIAVHGTCLGNTNLLFSSDLMGYAERALEGKLGGGVAIFTNAAEGDVGPARGGFRGAQALGDMVAETSALLWNQASTSGSVEIRGAYERRLMPPATFNTGCIPIPGSQQTLCNLLPGFSLNLPMAALSVPSDLPFQAIRIGDTVLATVPGEALTEVGADIKSEGAARGFRHTIVVGLANEHGSYFPDAAEYARGFYEAQGCFYGPMAGATIAQNAAALIDQVK